MKPFAWPTTSGSDRCRRRKARVAPARSRLKARTSFWLSSTIVCASVASGHERSHRENLVLLAKKPAERPASSTTVKTDSTDSPAAAWTVPGRRRSSFHVTPWPPVVAWMRRPVTMPVWLGSVRVSSCSVRALSVLAPWSSSAYRCGAPDPPEPAEGLRVEGVDGDGHHRVGHRAAARVGCGRGGRRAGRGRPCSRAEERGGGEQGDRAAYGGASGHGRQDRRPCPEVPIPLTRARRGSPRAAWWSGGPGGGPGHRCRCAGRPGRSRGRSR